MQTECFLCQNLLFSIHPLSHSHLTSGSPTLILYPSTLCIAALREIQDVVTLYLNGCTMRLSPWTVLLKQYYCRNILRLQNSPNSDRRLTSKNYEMPTWDVAKKWKTQNLSHTIFTKQEVLVYFSKLWVGLIFFIIKHHITLYSFYI